MMKRQQIKSAAASPSRLSARAAKVVAQAGVEAKDLARPFGSRRGVPNSARGRLASLERRRVYLPI
jgi:hypothetical protein